MHRKMQNKMKMIYFQLSKKILYSAQKGNNGAYSNQSLMNHLKTT